MKIFHVTLLFFLHLASTKELDPILKLLDPTKSNGQEDEGRNFTGWDSRCIDLYENHQETVCDLHMELYFHKLTSVELSGSDNLWPLKMADATGKIPDGLFEFNYQTYGNMPECLEIDVENPNGLNSFKGKYIIIQLGGGPPPEETDDEVEYSIQMPMNPTPRGGLFWLPPTILPSVGPSIVGNNFAQSLFKAGICVSDSCTDIQVVEGLEKHLCSYTNGKFQGLHSKPSVTSDKEKINLTNGDIVMIGIIVLFGVCLIIGTALEFYRNWISRKDQSLTKNAWNTFFLGFGIYGNTSKWLDTNIPKSSGHLGCIDGIRFLSMAWVVLGHAWPAAQTMNLKYPKNWFFNSFSNFSMQFISNGYVSVDSFFLISGTLLSYLTLKELDKIKGRVWTPIFWPMFYIHRYLRLSGTYAILIAFHATLFKYMCFGPDCSSIQQTSDGCASEWWKNLLYISNFGKGQARQDFGTCIGQTWYLSNDMQMFVFTPFIIYPMWKWHKFGISMSVLVTLVSIVIPTVLTVTNDWPATQVTGSFTSNPNTLDYFEWNYVKPWCRMSPYIIGLLLGYILHITKNKPFKMNTLVVIWGWIIALGVGFAVIYGLDISILPLMKTPSKFENAFYGGFHRAAWAVALGWLIFACCRGYGGWINTFLSWPAFIPLSRMSYIIYLTHLSVMGVVEGTTFYQMEGTNTIMTFFFLSVLVYSTIISSVIMVCIELPWLNTEKLFFSTLLRTNKRKVTQHTA